MNKKKWLLISVGFISLLCQGIVFAENRPGAVTFTLSNAYYHFNTHRHLRNTGLPNVALAYDFNERWAIEAGMGIINTDANNDTYGVHGSLYTLDGIYRFNKMKVLSPYVLAGVGVLGLKPVSNDIRQQGNLNAGIGTQIFFGDDIAIRGEFRDLLTTTGSTKNEWMVNLGISILFGGKE
jgi:hypothetical protein